MKKALSLILALVMVAGIFVGSWTPEASADGTTKISIMLPSFYGGEMDDSRAGVAEVKARITEITGIDEIDWQFRASDAYADTFGLTMMDRANMPMILTAMGSITGTVIQAAQQGAFWDLKPFLESGDYPYLAQADDEIYDILSVNGQIIGIPKMRNTGRYGLSYRKDWAEKVGITEDPQTVQDVYDMLYAFTYNDPDGNGVNDTYGLEAVGEYTGWMDVILTWFGCGYGWVEKDGNLVPVHETPEYKEALEWLHKVYADGLMRKDFVTVQTSDWGQAIRRGETGVIVDTLDSAGRRAWIYFNDEKVPSVVDPSVNASMSLVGPINGHTAAVQVYNGYFLITRDGCKTEDDVRACLQFLDRMNSVEGRALADWGIEGVHYTLDENGGAVSTTDSSSLSSAPYQGLNQAVGYIPYTLEGQVEATMDEPRKACKEVMTKTAEYAVFNPAEAYLTVSPTFSLNGTILAQTINDARTQFITGAIDWSGFEKAVATWEAQGGASLKAEVNEAYHAG